MQFMYILNNDLTISWVHSNHNIIYILFNTQLSSIYKIHRFFANNVDMHSPVFACHAIRDLFLHAKNPNLSNTSKTAKPSARKYFSLYTILLVNKNC